MSVLPLIELDDDPTVRITMEVEKTAGECVELWFTEFELDENGDRASGGAEPVLVMLNDDNARKMMLWLRAYLITHHGATDV